MIEFRFDIERKGKNFIFGGNRRRRRGVTPQFYFLFKFSYSKHEMQRFHFSLFLSLSTFKGDDDELKWHRNLFSFCLFVLEKEKGETNNQEDKKKKILFPFVTFSQKEKKKNGESHI